MKWAGVTLKLLFFVYTVWQLAAQGSLFAPETAALLLIAAISIFYEKYCSAIWVSFVLLAAVCAGALVNPCFGALLSVPAFDLAASAFPYAAALPLACIPLFFYKSASLPELALTGFVCCLFGVLVGVSTRRQTQLLESYDRERQLRYELEQAKSRLLASSKEASRLAQVQERNRIARAIHDSVGHSTAAVLIELRAAHRLMDRDPQRAAEMVGRCVEALSDCTVLLRDTVHGLRPQEHLGVEYLKSILNGYTYCPVDFKFSGDFGTLSSAILEILGSNLMEALTNVQRHSKATAVRVTVEINDKYTRLTIRDNGRGCPSIREGMGLGGMRERIANIGGTVSVSGDDGFRIICVIPKTG